ncbi:MAG: MMPL family transporter [Thermoanaerobaculum sp.]|nr:MMPL family transporter [Thermoanaerobaculum sp.]
MKALGGLAASCARLGLRAPRLVLLTAFSLVLLGGFLGSRIRFDSDVLNMLPQKDPLVGQFRQILQEFGVADTLLVVLRIPQKENLELAFALADALEEELKGSPHLSRVDAKLQDPLRLADAVLAHALFFLDEEGRTALRSRLAPEALAQRAQEIRQALETPQAVVAKELVVRDLLGVLPLLLQHLASSPGSLQVDTSSGYYLARDHSLLVILAYPTGPAQDIGFTQKMFADLQRRVASARQRVAQDWEVEEDQLPVVEFGGGHRIALEDATLIRRDTAMNSLTSLVGVSLLLLLAFGSLRAVAVTSAPLLTGLAMTFAFAGLVHSTISSAAAGFSALLIGLGIDFSIVLFARFSEAMNRNPCLASAWEETARETGPSIFLGAVTTLATFYAFLGTRFSGLKELGLLTGTGIVLLAFSALILVPALTCWRASQWAAPPVVRWLPLERILAGVGRHRRLVLASTLVLTLGLALFLPQLPFDDDVRHLRAPSNRGVIVQEEVAEAFGQGFSAMVVRLEAADDLALLQKTQDFVVKVQALQRRGVVARVESVATWVPPLAQQQEALSWLAQQQLRPEEVVATLRQELDRVGLVADQFALGLDLVAKMLSPSQVVTYDLWRGTPLETLIQRSLHHGGNFVSTAVTVFAPAGMWRREAPPELVALVRSTPGASLVGVNVLAQHLRQVVRQDALWACALGLAAVLVLLFVELRRWTDALLCLLPVAVGLVTAGGLAALLGLALNPLNVFVTTMAIGIGSDYGIHLVHRLRRDPRGVVGTARAVVLAALTTIVGFGSLITSHYPGLRSIGWMTVLAITLTCLAAVVLLPLLRASDAAQEG